MSVIMFMCWVSLRALYGSKHVVRLGRLGVGFTTDIRDWLFSTVWSRLLVPRRHEPQSDHYFRVLSVVTNVFPGSQFFCHFRSSIFSSNFGPFSLIWIHTSKLLPNCLNYELTVTSKDAIPNLNIKRWSD